MKRYFALVLVFALFATMLAGCRGKDNVSDNENGMIEDSSSTADTTERTTASTTESTEDSSEDTQNSGIMGEGDIFGDEGTGEGGNGSNGGNGGSGSNGGNGNNGGNSGGESSNSEETDPISRGRRSAPRF